MNRLLNKHENNSYVQSMNEREIDLFIECMDDKLDNDGYVTWQQVDMYNAICDYRNSALERAKNKLMARLELIGQ
jgi:hypothetical protein